jgi:hypothetical protein
VWRTLGRDPTRHGYLVGGERHHAATVFSTAMTPCMWLALLGASPGTWIASLDSIGLGEASAALTRILTSQSTPAYRRALPPCHHRRWQAPTHAPAALFSPPIDAAGGGEHAGILSFAGWLTGDKLTPTLFPSPATASLTRGPRW